MSLINGLINTEQENMRLEELEKSFNTSKKLGLDKCNKCGFCCYKRTCIPTPEEVIKIANFLKLTPKELINRYFAIDRKWMKEVYFVKPIGINIKELAGKFIPADMTFNEGKCIFLDDNNLCKIYQVRPQSARECQCWRKEKEYTNVPNLWRNDKLKAIFGTDGKRLESETED